MLFDWSNLGYWVLLGLGVILFLSVLIIEGDDQDLDGDLDLNPVLSFLGIGKSPLMLLLGINFTAWGVTGWILNVLLASLTGSIPTGGLAWLILFISMVFSLFLGKLLATPLGKIFETFGEDATEDRLIGCVGVVNSLHLPYWQGGSIGQVDVLDRARNLVTVTVCLSPWATVVPKRGEQVLIIDRQGQVYLAVAKDSLDQESWLNMRK